MLNEIIKPKLLQDVSQELSLTHEKHRLGVAELAKKEEQLVVLQVIVELKTVVKVDFLS